MLTWAGAGTGGIILHNERRSPSTPREERKMKQLFQVGFKERFKDTGYFEKIYVVAYNAAAAVERAREKLIRDAHGGDWYENDKEKQEYIDIVKDLKVAFVTHEGEVLV